MSRAPGWSDKSSRAHRGSECTTPSTTPGAGAETSVFAPGDRLRRFTFRRDPDIAWRSIEVLKKQPFDNTVSGTNSRHTDELN
jgi:hypothetical protein